MPVGNMQKLAGLAFVLTLGAPGIASAVTAEVARTCDAAVAKAFPPRQVGNPAAGSAKGSSADRRDYFNKCTPELSREHPCGFRM